MYTFLADQSPESILGSASFSCDMMLLYYFIGSCSLCPTGSVMAALRCQVQEEVVLSYKWSWLLGVACELNISRDVYFSEGTHRSSRRDSALNIGFGKSLVTWGIISFPLCLLLFLTMKDFSGRGLVFLQWDFLICIDHCSYSGHFSWYGDGIFL